MILRGFLVGMIFFTPALAQWPATFRFPSSVAFVPEITPASAGLARHAASGPATLTAHPENQPGESWIFTDRVALKLDPSLDLSTILEGRPLQLDRTVEPGLHVLQAPDAATAWLEAESLASLPEVQAAFPVAHAPRAAGDRYAAAPNDPFFRTRFEVGSCEIEPGITLPGQIVSGQWYLENRDPVTGAELGVDINIRPAWAESLGEGITVAVADTGVELSHSDLQASVNGTPHFNFSLGTADGSPVLGGVTGAHGTSVAGLIAGTANNAQGMTGVAPASRIASWVIFDQRGFPVSSERFGEVFCYADQVVAVQNHSWAPTGVSQKGPDALEEAGLQQAWTKGRGGLGTVLVFISGNGRLAGKFANDNGFASDPRTIGVTGVNPTGRATATAEPGSSILLAAPAGDDEFGGLFTTDLSGDRGANYLNFCPSFEFLSDFRWGGLGFKDTSSAAPQVSGVAALMLSVNPRLTARDVQQILLLSARHLDRADPDLVVNGAGLEVSHNVGYGIVNAAEAVRLAKTWSNRPPSVQITQTLTGEVPIPDGGYRVEVTGPNVPAELAFLPGLPGVGIQPDDLLTPRSLVDLGRATQELTDRLDGRGALIERGDIPYSEKLARAAAAGAAFAIVYNQETAAPGSCPGGDQLCVPAGTDYSPIPVIFLGRTAGLALLDLVRTNPSVQARIALNGPRLTFIVPDSLQCERVGVRLKTDFSVRGDLRVTLTSPSGTTSILQRYNADIGRGPVDWIYWSTHHYFEPSAGTWTLAVTDQAPGEGTGQILEASLILNGVPIEDSDQDGLDDHWELAWLSTQAYGAADDPDGDGYSVLRESLEGSNPLVDERTGPPDLGFFNEDLVRISWPGRVGDPFLLQTGADLGVWESTVTVPGQFPVTAEVVPAPAGGQGFFRVERVPSGER